MVDTAGTITKAANLMKEKGAASVRAVATHCIMSGPASERVQDSALEELVFTDSIPYSSRCAKVKQISIADILAETIRPGGEQRIHQFAISDLIRIFINKYNISQEGRHRFQNQEFRAAFF